MEQYPYRAVGAALEVIPRTLAQNCGANIIRTLTKLRAKHSEPDGSSFGINGITGDITDMKELGVWEPYAVKVCMHQTMVASWALHCLCRSDVCECSRHLLWRGCWRAQSGTALRLNGAWHISALCQGWRPGGQPLHAGANHQDSSRERHNAAQD